MARVDSLPDAAKGVLQTGCVIEREFSYELTKRVMGIPEQDLLSHLSALKDSELLYERGIYPQSTYIFRHALTREVVYDSILTTRKKRLHGEIGDAIEEIYRDKLDEHYGVLAEHYISGENYEKGAEYCRLAERKAEKAASLNDAIEYAKKRIACLERSPQTEDVQKKIIDARAGLGLYHLQMVRLVDAKEAVDPIVDLAVKRNYRRRVSQIYTLIGTYNVFVEEDFPKAFEYLEDALKIAEELNDILSLFMATLRLGAALSLHCEFDKALHYLERALQINVAANSLWGIAAIKSHIAMLVYDPQGKIDLAYQMSDEALRVAEESGDIVSKAHAYTALGMSSYAKGFLDEAEGHALKAVGFCEAVKLFGWWAVAHSTLGWIYFDRGQYQESQEHYEKIIRVGERFGFPPSQINLYKVSAARARVMINENDINLNEIIKCYDDSKTKLNQNLMPMAIADILLNIDDQHMSEAEHWIKKAIEAHKRYGMMFELGRDYALYAELLKRKGDLLEARENLNTAIQIFTECGADGWVKKAEEALAKI